MINLQDLQINKNKGEIKMSFAFAKQWLHNYKSQISSLSEAINHGCLGCSTIARYFYQGIQNSKKKISFQATQKELGKIVANHNENYLKFKTQVKI